MSGKLGLVVYGDAQASVIADVLNALPAVTGRATVAYVDAGAVKRDAVPRCDILLEQTPGEPGTPDGTPAAASVHVRFPELKLGTLWPFNCVNPFNRPDPPGFPHGRFPHGDSFLLSCLAQGVPRADALRLYAGPWNPSWPDLDALFTGETERLTALDAQNDVPIGATILEQFRTRRLFLAPHSPSDVLLSQLITQLLARAFPGEPAIAQADVPGVFSRLGSRDCFGGFALPIHPGVARYARLTWYDPNARYTYFDREQLTARTYYERFIDDALANGAGAKASPERTSIG